MARPPANKSHHRRYANIFLQFPGQEASTVTVSIGQPGSPDGNTCLLTTRRAAFREPLVHVRVVFLNF